MNWRVEVVVSLKKSILDPQGRTVERSLHSLGHGNSSAVRVGKHIELELSGEQAAVEAQAHQIAREVLTNPVVEDYHLTLFATTGSEAGR
jgi:phosphoribosylformylglycinamidine synthase subunit PurS